MVVCLERGGRPRYDEGKRREHRPVERRRDRGQKRAVRLGLAAVRLGLAAVPLGLAAGRGCLTAVKHRQHELARIEDLDGEPPPDFHLADVESGVGAEACARRPVPEPVRAAAPQ